MTGLLAAIQFLTSIPIRLKTLTEKQISWSMVYFPLVGFLIGLILAVCNGALSFLGVKTYLLYLVLVVILAGITSGLHLDGLADTADAFLSRKSPEEMLSVMRDSHIGTMGVLSLICIIMGKVFLLRSVPLS